MRNSTRERLFQYPNEYRILWETDTKYGRITCAIAGNSVVLIHEYIDEKDGFSLYTDTPNSIDETRKALGLKPLN